MKYKIGKNYLGHWIIRTKENDKFVALFQKKKHAQKFKRMLEQPKIETVSINPEWIKIENQNYEHYKEFKNEHTNK